MLTSNVLHTPLVTKLKTIFPPSDRTYVQRVMVSGRRAARLEINSRLNKVLRSEGLVALPVPELPRDLLHPQTRREHGFVGEQIVLIFKGKQLNQLCWKPEY